MSKTPFLLLFIFMLVPIGLAEAQEATPGNGTDADLIAFFLSTNNPTFQSGELVRLNASAFSNDGPLMFSWSQISNGAPLVTLRDADMHVASFNVPFATSVHNATLSFSVSITDGQNNVTGTIDVPVTLTPDTGDDVKPVISNVPQDIIRNVSGPSLVTFALPTAVDDVDGTVAVICDPQSGVTYQLGITVVTCMAQDSAGNMATASFDVTLNSFILEITAPDDLILEATGELTLVDPGNATTNRDATVTNDSPGLFALGSTTVTWTAQDGQGNIANDTQIITIQDTTDPVIVAPSDVKLEATGLLTMIDLGVATATDTVDPMPTITSDAPAFFPIGTTTITYTATDDSGNSATDIQRVTVQDTTEPMLVLPSDVTAEATGVLTMLDIGTARVTDNIDSITATNDSPDLFPVGETLVTWTAKDSSGNTVTAVQKITVQDTTNPYFDTPEFNFISVEATGILTPIELDPIPANDIVDSNVTVTNDAPDSYPTGGTFVTWIARDSSGNTAQYNQIVIVSDRTSPTITAPDDVTIEADGLLTMIQLGVATATDLVDRAPLITSDAPTSFPIGTTTITYTATDDANNRATDTQRVTVQDTTEPVLILPLNILSEATGVLTPVDIGTATVTDNVDSMNATNDAPDSFPLGETLVTWTAMDLFGNTATAVQTVTIRDTTNPTITVPDSIIAEATGQLTHVGIGNATASDIADPDVTVTNDSPGSFPVGETLVTWTARDDSNNTASDTQTVRIQDTTNPYFDIPESNVLFVNATGILTSLELDPIPANDIADSNVTVTNDSPDSFPLGATFVTWIAEDDSGNTARYDQVIVLSDNTSPAITAPDDIVIEADGLLTMIDLGVATATDLVDPSPRIISDAPTSFPIGVTTITYTATDFSMNSATDIQRVTVQDTTEPVLILPLNIISEATGVLTPLDIGTATVTDNVDTINATNDSPDSFPVGETRVTWTAMDIFGNTATAIQTVTIEDTTRPVFTSFPDDITVISGNDTFVRFETPTATDIFPVTVLCSHDSGGLFFIGSTLVTCIATDANGNSVRDSFLITVGSSIFETITDDFADLDSWDLVKLLPTPVEFKHFNNYTLELAATDGNSTSSALISGDGFGAIAGIIRDFSLVNYTSGNPLYLGIDYKAQSLSSSSTITNAGLEIIDADGYFLDRIILVEGGTLNSGWRTLGTDISQSISGQDNIRVRLYLYDSWNQDWNQRAFFDNFYLGVNPPPFGNISSDIDIQMTPLQELSLQISQYDQTQICGFIESLDESADIYADTLKLIRAYNMTTVC